MDPMRKPLAARLGVACAAVSASIALLGTAGAAFAGAVYVPVPDPISSTGSTHAIQIWITNGGSDQRPYTTAFLNAESDGTQRPSTPPAQTPLAAGRTSVLGGVSTPGKSGLLEINASAAMSVDARLFNTSADALSSSVSPVPLISSDNMFDADKTAVVLGLRRDPARGDITSLGVVNLGKQAAQCVIKFVRADGSPIGGPATLTFKPLSLRSFNDAFSLLGEQQAADARAEVSCNQPFYTYATLFSQANSQILFITPSASGASTLTGPGGTNEPPPSTTGSVVYSVSGLFHTVTTGNEKKTYKIGLAKAMPARRMVLDMDFVPGPWNRSKSPGNHAIVWLYRAKFRSNTFANVNAFSPPKMSLKAAQNVDLPPANTTQDDQGVAWVQGQRYHLKYTYDAEHGTVTAVLSSNGATVKTLQFPSTAPNGVLDIPTTGMTVEFGHYPGQEGPEVPSYGWQYSNLRIEFVPY
jgi:hypothetical protein